MGETQIHDLSAMHLRDAIRSGEISSRQAVAHFLERIDSLNDSNGAFISVSAGRALQEADTADELQAAGDATGLQFVGSVGPLAAALRNQGAISLGKTQVPEFGLTSYSENNIAPPARNPYDTALSAGGSSGGSAAAVATRMLPFGPASDAGGSIRIPAAATGLIGLKPNRGRVPAGSGQADAAGFGVAGPLARTAADAGVLLDAMVQSPHHRALGVPRRPRTISPSGAAQPEPPPSFLAAALRAEGRFRIGVSLASPFEGHFPIDVDPEAMAALQTGIDRLTALGHDVVEAPIHYDRSYPEAFTTAWTSMVAAAPIAEDREPDLMPLTRTYRERAMKRGAAEFIGAVNTLKRFEAETLRQFSDYDMILTPALAMTPRPVGWYTSDPDEDYKRQCQYCPFSSFVNVIGLPAITAPTLHTADGLPMGIQLIGRPGGEAELLSTVAQLEE
ncbi:amidase [Arthrobacter castelli]|uniref:amidase n=1 Tax=Arthrobacter castelli TaxID=271431 RepID=UPI00041C5C47|nr:amidase [Arthrobacter castelli]